MRLRLGEKVFLKTERTVRSALQVNTELPPLPTPDIMEVVRSKAFKTKYLGAHVYPFEVVASTCG